MPKPPRSTTKPTATTPSETYSIGEIEKLTRVTRRNLVNWVNRGLVASPEFRGAQTRWGRLHLARILAIKKMRGDYYGLDDIKNRLDKLTTDEIERFAGLAPADAPAATPAKAAAPASQAPRPIDAASFGKIVPSYPHERWERIELLPGMELHVRDEPLLRRVAQLVFDQFRGA